MVSKQSLPLFTDAHPSTAARGTLVCLPGVNSGAYLMVGAIAALPQWRVVLLNPPGVAGNPLPLPFTVKAYAQQALNTLTQLNVYPSPTHPVVLLGHSMGGYAAQSLARLAPQRFSQLILVSTSRGQPDTAQDIAALPQKLGMSFWQFQQLMEHNPTAAQQHLFAPSFAQQQGPVYQQFIQQRNAYLGGPSTSMAHLTAGGGFSSAAWVNTLALPTLVVHGDSDILVSPSSGQKLSAHLPNSRWLLLHQVGHFPMLEHPQFWSYIARFAQGESFGEDLATPPRWWVKPLLKMWQNWKLHG